MPSLLIYDTTTGEIRAVITATTDTALAAQLVPDGMASLAIAAETAEALTIPEQWYVNEATVQEKPVVVLAATPNPFDADGLEVCTVTVVGMVTDTTIEINGAPVTLTVADPTLLVTSDVPQTLVIRLPTAAPQWAEPLIVEAV